MGEMRGMKIDLFLLRAIHKAPCIWKLFESEWSNTYEFIEMVEYAIRDEFRRYNEWF